MELNDSYNYASLVHKLNAMRSKPHTGSDYCDACFTYIDTIHRYNNAGDFNKTLEGGRKILSLMPEREVFLKNKLLNEIELAEKKVVLESKVRALLVNVTSSCNLNCIMCGQHDNTGQELSDKVVLEISHLFPYLEKILWQGGEPLLYGRMKELIGAAGAYPYLRQHINTNGLLLDEEWAEFLINNRVSVQFSIDSTEKDVYERIRKGANFEKLLSNLRYFSEYRKKKAPSLYTFINMVVMRSNHRQMESMLEFAHELDFNHVIFMSANDFADKTESIFDHKDAEALAYIKNALPDLDKKAQEYGIALSKDGILPVCGQGSSPAGFDRSGGNTRFLCHMPWSHMYIHYNGSVYPYCQCEWGRPAGNSFQSPLEDIWNNETMAKYRKSIVAGDYAGMCKKICTDGRFQESSLKFI